MKKVAIEVCCGSVDDAVRAYQAGADRIELNSALFAGGLTPSLGTLKAVRERLNIPVICMLRPRAGGFCYSQLEFETMLADLRALSEAGADGFAVGCLTENGELDHDRLSRLVETAGDKEMVFHRAFDAMKADPFQTVESLARLGFARLLTSGRGKTALLGAELIEKLVKMETIQILPGSGIRPHNAAELINKTGCDQLHFTFHKTENDTSMLGSPVSFSGSTLPDDKIAVTDSEGLAAFIAQIHSYQGES